MTATQSFVESQAPQPFIRLQTKRSKAISLADRHAHLVLLAPTMIAILVINGYPLAYGVIVSFQNLSLANPVGKFVGFDNYVRILGDSATWGSIGLTIVFTGFSVLFSFLLGLLGAVLLNRPMPFRGIIRSLFIIPWAVPAFVAALTWSWIYNDQFGILTAIFHRFGIGNVPIWLGSNQAMTSLIVVMVWKSFPFQLVMLLAGLQAIPQEVYEAAQIDGAKAFQQFWNITLPLLRPVALIAIFMAVINAFQYFPIPWILTSGGPSGATNVISISSYNLAFNVGEVSLGSTVACVMFLVTFVGAIGYVWYYIKKVGQI